MSGPEREDLELEAAVEDHLADERETLAREERAAARAWEGGEKQRKLWARLSYDTLMRWFRSEDNEPGPGSSA